MVRAIAGRCMKRPQMIDDDVSWLGLVGDYVVLAPIRLNIRQRFKVISFIGDRGVKTSRLIQSTGPMRPLNPLHSP